MMPDARTEAPDPVARLLRFITLAGLGLAGVWTAWALQAGQPWLALGGLTLLFTVHALVLALEFVLMARLNASDSAPRASLAQHAKAWLREALCAPRVFCWRQPYRSRSTPDHLPAGPKGRGVLLVHGLLCNRGLWIDWMVRLRAQGTPCLAVNLGRPFGGIDDYLPAIERAVAALEQLTGVPPVIVGHSMGGLVARKWWSQPASHGRVHRLITLGTPHHGTWLARFAVSPNARQMRIGSRWLQSLAEAEPAHHAERTVCFYSHCDNIVFPASTATLHGADNRHLPGVPHVHMVDSPEPLDELLRLVA